MNYQFKNILGTFVVDDSFTAIVNSSDAKAKELPEEELPEDKTPLVLPLFKNKIYFQQFYLENLRITRQALQQSVTEDQLVMQTISNIGELDKIINILVKRLREWHSLYLPELSQTVREHQRFLEFILKPKPLLLKELQLSESMGADLAANHINQIKSLSEQVKLLYGLRASHESYLAEVMQNYCPNLLELAGTTIGAKLIELAKGLKNLALLPASTVQLLGAEKALFRHIKTGSRSPKHGIILNHQFVQKVDRNLRGKAARMLADKLSLCARLDYFKGEFKAKKYWQELEEALR